MIHTITSIKYKSHNGHNTDYNVKTKGQGECPVFNPHVNIWIKINAAIKNKILHDYYHLSSISGPFIYYYLLVNLHLLWYGNFGVKVPFKVFLQSVF